MERTTVRIIPLRPDKKNRETVRHPFSTGLSAFLVICSLSLARSILIPVTLAMVLFIILNRSIRNLERFHIPRPFASLAVVAVIAILFGLASLALLESGWKWTAIAPESMAVLETRVRDILHPLGHAGLILEGIVNTGKWEDVAASLTGEVVGSAGTVMSHAVLVVVLLLFLLGSGDRFWHGVSHLCSVWMERGEFMHLVQKAEMGLSTYFFTVAVINIGVGVLVGLGMHTLGMPDPVLWGTLTTLLNFVPYLGAMVGEVIVAIVALVTFDSAGYALLAPTLYLMIAFIEGNFVTPMILGKRFTFRPVTVILSMIFWGWLWGTIGLLLAFPMLMLFGIVCENVSSLDAIGKFLKTEAPNANTLTENTLMT